MYHPLLSIFCGEQQVDKLTQTVNCTPPCPNFLPPALKKLVLFEGVEKKKEFETRLKYCLNDVPKYCRAMSESTSGIHKWLIAVVNSWIKFNRSLRASLPSLLPVLNLPQESDSRCKGIKISCSLKYCVAEMEFSSNR